ncbi:MAG: MarR family winged helix-turn-helix transcriptional regulator [Acidimicrobiia bacterium]
MANDTDQRSTDAMLRPSAWLMRASSDVSHLLATEAVADTGLDPTTLDLLLRLRVAAGGKLRGVDLCDQLHKSPSHVSRVIDRAEAAGLVRREPDPNDRRAHLIAATPAGESATDEYLPHLEAVLQRVIFDTFSSDEIETMIGLLSKVSYAARSEMPST